MRCMKISASFNAFSFAFRSSSCPFNASACPFNASSFAFRSSSFAFRSSCSGFPASVALVVIYSNNKLVPSTASFKTVRTYRCQNRGLRIIKLGIDIFNHRLSSPINLDPQKRSSPLIYLYFCIFQMIGTLLRIITFHAVDASGGFYHDTNDHVGKPKTLPLEESVVLAVTVNQSRNDGQVKQN